MHAVAFAGDTEIVGADVSYLIFIGSDGSDMLSLLSTALMYTVMFLPSLMPQFSCPDAVIPFVFIPPDFPRIKSFHVDLLSSEYWNFLIPTPSSVDDMSVYTCLLVHVPLVYVALLSPYFAVTVGFAGFMLSIQFAVSVPLPAVDALLPSPNVYFVPLVLVILNMSEYAM